MSNHEANELVRLEVRKEIGHDADMPFQKVNASSAAAAAAAEEGLCRMTEAVGGHRGFSRVTCRVTESGALCSASSKRKRDPSHETGTKPEVASATRDGSRVAAAGWPGEGVRRDDGRGMVDSTEQNSRREEAPSSNVRCDSGCGASPGADEQQATAAFPSMLLDEERAPERRSLTVDDHQQQQQQQQQIGWIPTSEWRAREQQQEEDTEEEEEEEEGERESCGGAGGSRRPLAHLEEWEWEDGDGDGDGDGGEEAWCGGGMRRVGSLEDRWRVNSRVGV
ncbi:hypothetical protein AXG93_2175s1190 [Marchantia polymorpha subsp. ruderalis]|uniref:Uncharacterized protein n=1 Tax=Marchantia polymorpha subsp. ruderalis TaxID=1480154 RepID=A0A176W8P2_MARPO|nr:hypothetical protein AXG93_2175s1190 [Marchantia polymorpha subsp. ruderalis]